MFTNTIEQSIRQLITTGNAKNGNFEGVDINQILEISGLATWSDGEQTYFLNKFDDVLDLEGANLQGAKLKLLSAKKINFKNANLSFADISNNSWDEVDFSGADLSRANLTRSRFRKANFEGVNASAMELLGGDFSNANFKDAYMDGVDMRAANFEGVNFENAVIDSDGPYDPRYLGANFTDANFKGSEVSLTEYISDGTETGTQKAKKHIFFCRTIMPNGTTNNRDCDSVPSNFSWF